MCRSLGPGSVLRYPSVMGLSERPPANMTRSWDPGSHGPLSTSPKPIVQTCMQAGLVCLGHGIAAAMGMYSQAESRLCRPSCKQILFRSVGCYSLGSLHTSPRPFVQTCMQIRPHAKEQSAQRCIERLSSTIITGLLDLCTLDRVGSTAEWTCNDAIACSRPAVSQPA